MSATPSSVKLNFLNSILASPALDKANILRGHRRARFLQHVNNNGYTSGLKWIDGCKVGGATDDTFVLATDGEDLDYCNPDAIVEKFPKALRDYLSVEVFDYKTRLMCKKSIPLSVLEKLTLDFPIMGTAVDGETDKMLHTEYVTSQETYHSVQARTPVYLDDTGNTVNAASFFKGPPKPSKAIEANHQNHSALHDVKASMMSLLHRMF